MGCVLGKDLEMKFLEWMKDLFQLRFAIRRQVHRDMIFVRWLSLQYFLFYNRVKNKLIIFLEMKTDMMSRPGTIRLLCFCLLAVEFDWIESLPGGQIESKRFSSLRMTLQ